MSGAGSASGPGCGDAAAGEGAALVKVVVAAGPPLGGSPSCSPVGAAGAISACPAGRPLAVRGRPDAAAASGTAASGRAAGRGGEGTSAPAFQDKPGAGRGGEGTSVPAFQDKPGAGGGVDPPILTSCWGEPGCGTGSCCGASVGVGGGCPGSLCAGD
eukprot:2675681-Lingulodinium_polyedra.AAC.1